ncbi:sarcosine oxidase subunit gamma [Microbacterium karelineae]|uniref:sarcosine oxidase subunit gamma n=1 Tax=Microbacterium karelineae TaxID=2654283 RepID=UPI0012EA446A|nr:sarcosine oxidase subunit gamma family protein [Microbacterium karelineae]
MADSLTAGPRELRRSPLDHLAAELDAASAPGIRLREIPFTTQIGVRAEPGSSAHGALSDATGVGLPAGVGDVAGDASGTAALWLAPDEFLVIAEPDSRDLVAALWDALGDAPGQVTDLSANRTILEVAGPCARDALDKGVPADLHPRAFAPNMAITTTLSTVPVLVWRTAVDTYLVLPRASFAEHVAQWLMDAAREYHTQETAS